MLVLQNAKGVLGRPPLERPMEELLRYGIAVIDKPPGPSSHEVSAFTRKILGLKVTGHTGTLDQNVSGVLVVLLENSRKISGYAARADKKYVCLMKLGKVYGKEDVEAACSNFRGEVYQRPPLQSAVAKKLRVRKIHSLEILEIRGSLVLFECFCEAGTYIRKLVYDAGEILGTKAEMLELRRTLAGAFSDKDSVSLQKLADYYWAWKENGDEKYLRKAILPIEAIHMKKVVITDAAAVKVKNGIRPKIGDVAQIEEGISERDLIGIYTLKGELIAAGRAQLAAHEVQAKKGGDGDALPVAAIERVIHEF